MNERGGKATDGPNVSDFGLVDEEARDHICQIVDTVASFVRSTYGPKGLETLLSVDSSSSTHGADANRDTVVTNQGSHILDILERESAINHPIAALLIDNVDSMQRRLGDGTTTALLLTSALVKQGTELIDQGLRPTNVSIGYMMANARTGDTLDDLAREIQGTDKRLLTQVAKTALAGSSPASVDSYATAIGSVIGELSTVPGDELTLDGVKILTTDDSRTDVERGLIIRRHPSPTEDDEWGSGDYDWTIAVPDPLKNVRVGIVNGTVDVEEIGSWFGKSEDGATVVGSVSEIEQYKTELDAQRTRLARHFTEIGADLIVAQEAFRPALQEAIENEGIVVIDEVQYPLSDIHRLARATESSAVSSLDELESRHLGTATHVVEERRGDEKWTSFRTESDQVFTLIVSEPTAALQQQYRQLVKSALAVTATASMDGQILPGAGAATMAVSSDLRRNYAPSVGDREQLAIEGFANALEETVHILLDNAGYDHVDIVTKLRAAHSRDEPVAQGFDVTTRDTVDAYAAGIVEPRRVFSYAVDTAYTTAEQLLTTDALLTGGVDLTDLDVETERD